MTAATTHSPVRLPPLQSGDRLTLDEFQERYRAMREPRRAELINGVVYMSPPTSLEHGSPHADLIGLLFMYRTQTPGVGLADNTTTRLGGDNEVQPDASLFVLPSHGGRARISPDQFLLGAPELIAEIAVSSASYDLHDKLDVYRRSGVQEYLVWRVLDGAIDYLHLRDGRYEPLPATDGVHRSSVFPGLWLNIPAMLRHDLPAAVEALGQGLASEEHARFVELLTSRIGG